MFPPGTPVMLPGVKTSLAAFLHIPSIISHGICMSYSVEHDTERFHWVAEDDRWIAEEDGCVAEDDGWVAMDDN